MIPVSMLFGILGAMCLIPSLYHGARQDLKEFKFSEIHFQTFWVNAAFVLTIIMYICLLSERNIELMLWFIGTSLVCSLVFLFIAFRYGGGGDWRALIYIALIAPFMMGQVLVAISLCAVVQSLYWILRPDIPLPPMFRHIPFAVSIFCGYIIALLLFVLGI